ncbi:reverse transcriptase domain-containing protein [Tanacetum coccineum]
MEDDFKLAVQHQRRVNPKIHEVIKKEVIKLLDAGLIYPISDSPWVSPVHCVPKKDGMTVVENEDNELIPTRLVTGCRVCVDYRKLNDATRKDHFPLPFMDQMLERLAGNEYYSFLDRFSGYFQISIDPQDQDKTTFTCPYGTFAFRLKDSFSSCLSHLDKMLKRCEDTNLVLNWEKCHFMVKEGIVLGHKISKSGIEVDRAKVDVIAKLPHPTSVKDAEDEIALVMMCSRAMNAVDVLTVCHNGPIDGDILGCDYTLKDLCPYGPIDFNWDRSTFLWIQRTFSLAVRYLSKWVEAKALPTNDARVVVKFLKSLFARFGTPRAIISDHGTHFYNDQFAKVMLKYEVTHRLSTAYHPQTSGQVEVLNRGLKRILERTVGKNRASWSNKLEDALWAFCTTFKTPIGCTPYKLV